MLEKYLRQLLKELGLGSLPSSDEKGLFSLKLNDIEIFFKHLDPGLYLYGKIVELLPEHKKEDVLALIMKANFLGQGTGGSTIALTEDESFLTLSLGLPYDMNYKEFKETVEDFTNFIDYWKTRLSKPRLK